jgi:hypothetical protein
LKFQTISNHIILFKSNLKHNMDSHANFEISTYYNENIQTLIKKNKNLIVNYFLYILFLIVENLKQKFNQKLLFCINIKKYYTSVFIINR